MDNLFDKIFNRGAKSAEKSPKVLAGLYNNHGIELPLDVWVEILLRIDDSSLFQCRLVCRTWNETINSSSFWIEKCKKNAVPLPPSATSGNFDYRRIYFKKPFGRNFIKNPDGNELLQHWTIVKDGGSGFRIEKPPKGSDKDGFPSCFATSYGACVKEQLVDLQKEGCDSWILDDLQPKIIASEWHAARFDCASTYKLYVALLKKKPVPVVEEGPWDNGTNRDDDSPYRRQPPQNVVAEFFQPTIVEQWLGKAWQETTHTFENYGPGVRYVLFQSYGKDRQFWAGHYGPKMAGASLMLKFD